MTAYHVNLALLIGALAFFVAVLWQQTAPERRNARRSLRLWVTVSSWFAAAIACAFALLAGIAALVVS